MKLFARSARRSQENPYQGPDNIYEISVGEILSRTRRQRGLTLQEVSTALRIRVKHLEALETSEWKSLPGKVYIIGFTRSYAEHLELDGEKIVRLLKIQSDGFTNFTPRLYLPSPSAEYRAPGWKTLLLAFLLIILTFYSWDFYKDKHMREEGYTFSPLSEDPPAPQTQTASAGRPPPIVLKDTENSSDTPLPPQKKESEDGGHHTHLDPSQNLPSDSMPAAMTDTNSPILDIPILNPSTPDDILAEKVKEINELDSITLHEEVLSTQTAQAARNQQMNLKHADNSPLQGDGSSPDSLSPAGGSQWQAGEPALAGNGERSVSSSPLVIVVTESSWVGINGPNGEDVLSRILRPGDKYVIPQGEEGLILSAGNAGGLKIMAGGDQLGALGKRGAVVRGIELTADELRRYTAEKEKNALDQESESGHPR